MTLSISQSVSQYAFNAMMSIEHKKFKKIQHTSVKIRFNFLVYYRVTEQYGYLSAGLTLANYFLQSKMQVSQ